MKADPGSVFASQRVAVRHRRRPAFEGRIRGLNGRGSHDLRGIEPLLSETDQEHGGDQEGGRAQ